MKGILLLTGTGNLLRNRVLRNVMLWLGVLLLYHGMNVENDRAYHYGFFRSPWYGWVFFAGFSFQIFLVYTNNLLLIPRLLIRGRRLVYALCLVLLTAAVSLCYTLVLKKAAAHIKVSKLEQVGVPVSTSWTAESIRGDTQTQFAGNLILIAIFSLAWYTNDYARQRKAAEAAKKQQSETELAFLQSQLAPHFLFNTLNNIYALTLRESAAAPDAMLKLSAILRALLYEGGQGRVSFEKEAEIIRAYVDLELLRLPASDRFRFEVRADGDYAVPPLLWLPLLENVFKHGTRFISEDLFVDFAFLAERNTLTIRSRNAFKETAAEADGKGIGLANLRRRLALLYPGRHHIATSRDGAVFTAVVTVQLL